MRDKKSALRARIQPAGWIVPVLSIVAIAGYVLWVLFRGTAAAPRFDAGRAASAEFLGTTGGVFLVVGWFPLLQGHLRVLEKQRNGRFFLCGPALDMCAKVLND